MFPTPPRPASPPQEQMQERASSLRSSGLLTSFAAPALSSLSLPTACRGRRTCLRQRSAPMPPSEIAVSIEYDPPPVRLESPTRVDVPTPVRALDSSHLRTPPAAEARLLPSGSEAASGPRPSASPEVAAPRRL